MIMNASPVMQILLSLLFILMMLNTLLLNQCMIREHTVATSENMVRRSEDGENRDVRLCLVLPYLASNRTMITDSLEKWVKVGSPCLHSEDGEADRQQPALIFYLNTILTAEDQILAEEAKRYLGEYSRCFSKISIINADLKGEDDLYPAGPSIMFFKIFHDPKFQIEFSEFTHMFWMEYDVTPVRAGWLDALENECSKGNFWMSGSVFVGEALDSAVRFPSTWSWVGHINGNALYDMKDPIFRDFLRAVVQYEPPTHYWKPFDISIWRVLNTFPYLWSVYQQYRSKFVYSEFIAQWGYFIKDYDVEFTATRKNTFLVHGSNKSAGNFYKKNRPPPPGLIWHDRVPTSAKLSIMIRSFIVDMDYCFEAVMSAITYVPDALEYVIIVPVADVPSFEEKFRFTPKPVRIVGEPVILENQHVQQKWSKLHADGYCAGDLILHLDSDVVFNRELLLRDLLWLGKPLLTYQRYESIEALGFKILWRKGTSFAVGAPIYHEFSRSPLHVYPRHIYKSAREHIERVHQTSFTEFLRTRQGQHTAKANESLLFSDFNYIGAYAWKHARQDFSFAPMDYDERRQMPLPAPIVFSPLCQGNARLANSPRLVRILLAAMREIWTKGLPCERMPNLLLLQDERSEPSNNTAWDEKAV